MSSDEKEITINYLAGTEVQSKTLRGKRVGYRFLDTPSGERVAVIWADNQTFTVNPLFYISIDQPE